MAYITEPGSHDIGLAIPVQRMNEGQAQALEALYDRTVALVYGIALRVRRGFTPPNQST